MADTTQETPTFDDIRAILRTLSEETAEVARSQKETDRQMQETRQLLKEQSREADRRKKELDLFLKEQAQEADRRQQKTERFLNKQAKASERSINKLRGVFTSQWGELVESLVEGDLVRLLQQRRVAVDSILERPRGRRNGEDYEFDIVAGNGDEVVVVEVKTTLRSEDVTHFLHKLRRFTVYEPRYRGEKIYGAVAYLKADGAVTKYAERQGLFVIRATGDSASIINAEDFKPAVFS